jgi:hypothetical protein
MGRWPMRGLAPSQCHTLFTPESHPLTVPPVICRRTSSSFVRFRRLLVCVGLVCASGLVQATVYQVGPGRVYKNLQAVTGLLKGGDTVMVDGGVSYPGGVTFGLHTGPAIQIIGLRVNGRRPIITGSTAVMRVFGSHYVIEGFDITEGGDAGTKRCFYNAGDDVTLRDCVVHDSRCTGIAGSDSSGSLTLDRVEVFHCGTGLYAHQIYVGSSLANYPAALFRMQYCYVHDGTGGNNVKSRVTRNEIEYNWIEGAAYHELDMVGPDPKAQKTPPGGIHCDADIIGNVFVKRANTAGTLARFGTDSTASSRGRYRFINNTVVVESRKAAGFGLFWFKGEVDSLSVWNNVFATSVGPMKFVRLEVTLTPQLSGDGNWVPAGSASVPQAWGIFTGPDPGFVNAAGGDYRPAPGSPLIGAGKAFPPGIVVTGVPPERKAPVVGGALRPAARARDIGAFPYEAAHPQVTSAEAGQ